MQHEYAECRCKQCKNSLFLEKKRVWFINVYNIEAENYNKSREK